jgi:hypothetical protein
VVEREARLEDGYFKFKGGARRSEQNTNSVCKISGDAGIKGKLCGQGSHCYECFAACVSRGDLGKIR